jgi:formate C-acetyltransferase
MPQVFNDTSIVPALERQGIAHADAMDYAVVGCVELSTQGNSLGWSDAAMFNLVKALELTLNHGRCLLTGAQLGLDLGGLDTYQSFAQVEEALAEQVRHFVARMMDVCRVVDRIHAEVLPTPFLSSVIDDCLARGIDVTAGGATYNLSGIQAIQVANLADCLAAIKHLVFDEGCLAGADLLEALRRDFADDEPLRRMLLSRAPKYGNGVAWVDDLGAQWAERFALAIEPYVNARGGRCHMGLYTVSAHVPMGKNVGATPDGRLAGAPLADGGLSAVYGRDERGPTALLQSVARIPSIYASNGSLLNMKFLPAFFATPEGRTKFVALLHTLVHLRIHHAQFNVVRAEDLIAAREHPELHRHLTIRVAGYTAYFTELANELQQEIIARTSYGEAP